MPVGRGHHGVARAERIGQRARSDLRLGQIRREINVRRADEPHQFLQLDEAIEEHDVLLHAEIFGQPLQAQAVSLALVAQQIRMRLAQHDVNDVGKFADDVRQCAQRKLDALVRREQTEREQHLFARHAELVLEIIRVGERHVGNAVRDEIDLGRRRLIDIAQEFRGRVRVITTSRVESRIKSRITRRCSAFGSRSTVCSVVTIGIRSSRSSAST